MKKALKIILPVVVVCVFVIIGFLRKGGEREVRVAVIPKATTHIFWESVRMGAEEAARQMGVEMEWTGPERESDREKQIQIIEDSIVGQVSGIVLAPNDSKALVPVVERVSSEGIPCAIIDSAIETDEYVCFAATDNYKGGVIAARRMGKILAEKGRVIVIKYLPGSASTTKRENGFLDTIKKEFPEIELVEEKYGMDTVETALQATEDLLTKYSEIDGLFACNASTAVGALQALAGQGRLDEIEMIGFDAEEALLDALKSGRIDSLVVQNPYQMGYEGLKAVVKVIRGQEVPKRIDTGVKLVTRENLETPEIKELLRYQ